MSVCRGLVIGLVAVVTGLAGVSKAPLAEEKIRLAVFGFELIDSSLQGDIEGENAADAARLSMIEADLKRQLTESGRYDLIDVSPAAEAIEAAGYLHGCNGCEAKIAKGLGADQALIGWVQKVSNLILNLNVGMRDAESRRKVFAASVDIRGNTDVSWRHGIRYLIKRKMFKDNSKIDRR
ncbi:MAG: DUF3280 domain-containing protein [Alphaproteobacteria bacterium]|nr:DUF3280 domain-containing protein [Alphaproteobacteria bacterium]